MRTLSRNITREWFPDAAAYEAVRLAWKEALKSDDLCPEHHMLYAMIRGKDYTKGFPLPTNQRKLDNGYRPSRSTAFYTVAAGRKRHERQPDGTYLTVSYDRPELLLPFKDTITPEMLESLRKFLPGDPSPKKDPYVVSADYQEQERCPTPAMAGSST